MKSQETGVKRQKSGVASRARRRFLISVTCLIASLVGLLTACENDSCLRSTGADATETRTLQAGFHSITVHDNIDLVLTHDTTRGADLLLSGGGNLLEYITADVNDSLLQLRVDTQCDWLRNLRKRFRLTLNITTPLRNLETRWTSTLRSTDTIPTQNMHLQQNSTSAIDLTVSGGGIAVVDMLNLGSVRLAGELPVLVPVVFDIAELNTYDLTCGYLFLYHYATATARVTAEKKLWVTNYESATVRWRGQPIEREFLNPGGGQFIDEN
jgi:Putative auto-transporter adhesin, head GIN domain